MIRKLFAVVARAALVFSGAALVSGVIGYVLVFHGPLTELKEVYVTSAMTTLNHQYLAEWLVPKDEIDAIMANNQVPEPSENTDESVIHIDIEVQAHKPPVELIEIKGKAFKGFLFKVANPENVSLVAADSLGKRGMKVEEIATQHQALAAINAGGFSDADGHGNGGTPLGLLISDGKILNQSKVNKHTIIGFDRNNVLVLGTYTLDQIKRLQIRDAITFGPFLVVNGKGSITKGDGGWGIAPRTAIGQTADGTVLLLVIDGRQVTSLGASLKDVQDIMLQHGAVNAANLDGGSSSTLYYAGKVVNKPSGRGGPRYVPNAFIVKQGEAPKRTVIKAVR